jgi:DNA-binding NtrC family response regulator
VPILHVDDHDGLRELVRRALEVHGFSVVSAAGVAAAKDVLTDRDDVSGALIDVGLRDGTGMELYDWIAVHRPALASKVAFVTGGASAHPGHSLVASGCRVIAKPFPLADIVGLASAWESS